MSETAVRAKTTLDMIKLGVRIRAMRLAHRLSLDDLAARATVSRSMLSDVERGAKVPSVMVLHSIATGLDTTIARLLGEERPEPVIVLRRAEQDVARDPTGWERRILSPVVPGVEFEFMRTAIPAGLDLGASPPHTPGSREYVAVEHGSLLLTVDGTPHTLHAGDSIYYAADRTHAFANPGDGTCVYYLVVNVGASRAPIHGHSSPPLPEEPSP